MRRTSLTGTVGVLALISQLILPAQPQGLGMITGQMAHDRVNKLTSQIAWHTSLYQAEDEARHEGKMVFWVHMLGDIKSDT